MLMFVSLALYPLFSRLKKRKIWNYKNTSFFRKKRNKKNISHSKKAAFFMWQLASHHDLNDTRTTQIFWQILRKF